MNKFLNGSAWSVLALTGTMCGVAMAQSTGTRDFEEEMMEEVIVTAGARKDPQLAGVVVVDTSKARGVLNQEMISRQQTGNSILNTINLLPGVSFQNNDAYGSAGGKLSIRGFSADRISLTFDGIPLNDTGNYAIYSSQQLDPELIEQVNVNLGSTDVDSPTASASGSTVNYRTRKPTEELGGSVSMSMGRFGYRRGFAVLDTGEFGPVGTRAYISASQGRNDVPFNNFGEIHKKQFNAKIWQPIGDDGDFIALSGHYNESRNNFFGSVRLTQGAVSVPDRAFPQSRAARFFTIPACTTRAPGPGAQTDTGRNGECGSIFDQRVNPSNTGNIRINSKFTLTEGLVLTIDPSYQYVKANGGGVVDGREGTVLIGGVRYTGYVGGKPYYNADLNGDGDLLDAVNVHAPSQTQTDRFGVISSLRYEFNDQHSVRVAYTHDNGDHRQTGQTSFLSQAGVPFEVFSIDNPISSSDGHVLQKRDRHSKAILNQISSEYRGKFLDDRMLVTAGLRVPFFKRNLTNYCFTTSAGGNVECFSTNSVAATAYGTANPTRQGPQTRNFKYDKLLPNIGITHKLTDDVRVFANYSKGLQVPGTDSLYNSFFFAPTAEEAKPSPETTDNFDIGMRYISATLQMQVSTWFTRYQNRLASAYDPDLNTTVYRNLGTVDKYGIDGSVSYKPVEIVNIYLFGSYLKSKIKEDVIGGEVNNVPVYLPTKGMRESGAPVYTVGARLQVEAGPLSIAAQFKRTGKRYINDQNVVYFPWRSETAPEYNLVDLDAVLPLSRISSKFHEKSALKLNVSNLFDKVYVGGFDGGLTNNPTSPPFVQVGAPRTISGTLSLAF